MKIPQYDSENREHYWMLDPSFDVRSIEKHVRNIKRKMSAISKSSNQEKDEPIVKKPKKEILDLDEDDNSGFNKIRGLVKKIGANHYYFASHKKMLEYKNMYKTKFAIQILPQADFTMDEFNKFVFPNPIDELVVVPEKLSKTVPKSGATKCGVCKTKLRSATALKEHNVKSHTVHYMCPYDKCGHAVQKLENELSIFKFARHIFYHYNDHPQLQCPHICLACGYTTPYIANVREHIKIQGPYHNNKCPNCPEIFYTRSEILQHKKLANHEGYCCGLCSEVFETSLLKNQHRGVIHGKCKPKQPKGEIVCEGCGKVFSNQGALNTHRDRVHGPSQEWPCEQCGKIFKTKYNLTGHVKTTHNKKPCPVCGKMFFTERMKTHMIATHTEDHLKPFICHVCKKGIY